MGYRSEVALWLTPSSQKEVDKLPKGVQEVLSQADEKWEVDGHVLYYWKDIKWYREADKDIGALMDTVEEQDVSGEPATYCFWRIGEDYGDVEVVCGAEGPFSEVHIYIHREMVLPPTQAEEREEEDE